MDRLSNQLLSDPMGVTMSREEDNYSDQPSIDADLRAVDKQCKLLCLKLSGIYRLMF